MEFVRLTEPMTHGPSEGSPHSLAAWALQSHSNPVQLSEKNKALRTKVFERGLLSKFPLILQESEEFSFSMEQFWSR
jgi:hypothetical protein